MLTKPLEVASLIFLTERVFKIALSELQEKAIHLKAPEIHLAGTVYAPEPPYKPGDDPVVKNDADKKTEISDATSKAGYCWPQGLPGEVFKPKSASDGKLVTLSPSPEPHQLYEAIPTPALEGAEIVYLNADGTNKTWKVVRPVFVPGKLIDTAKSISPFEDKVRYLQRWSKPGEKYPTMMFLKTGGGLKLILDSSVRHHFIKPFPPSIPIVTA